MIVKRRPWRHEQRVVVDRLCPGQSAALVHGPGATCLLTWGEHEDVASDKRQTRVSHTSFPDPGIDVLPPAG
jgi:hypothetical protein